MRQAGLPGDRPLGLAERLALDAVDELLELGLGDRLVGLLALLAVGRREALDELAGDADDDLASAGSRPSPRLPGGRPRSCRRPRRCRRPCPTACGDRPCRLRPTPRTVPCPSSSISKTSALANSVPMSSAVQAASASAAVALPDPAPEGHQPPVASMRRTRRRGSPPSASGQPLAARALALGHLRSAAAPAVDRGHGDRARGRRPTMPRATRSSLTVTKSCGSSASRPSAITPDAERAADVLGRALERVHRFVRARRRRPAGRRARPPRRDAASSPGLGRPAAAARLEPALRLAQLVLERRDPVRRAPSTRLGADGRRRPLERRRRARRASASAAGAGHRLDAAHPGADAPLAGDHEAADLAGRPAVRAAAQLVAVALDPDRCAPSRRTSRRRRRRRRASIASAIVMNSIGPAGRRG